METLLNNVVSPASPLTQDVEDLRKKLLAEAVTQYFRNGLQLAEFKRLQRQLQTLPAAQLANLVCGHITARASAGLKASVTGDERTGDYTLHIAHSS